MFVVWGTKLLHKASGTTTLFCPICRTIATCQVSRAVEHRHLYFKAMGKGKAVLDTAICEKCTCEFPGEVGSFGNPGLNSNDAMRRRQELETRVRSGKLSAEERKALLVEPFVAMEYTHRRRLRYSSQTSIVSVLVLATIVLAFVALVLWVQLPGATPRERPASLQWATGTSITFVIALAVTVWYSVSNHRRRSVRHELPAVAGSLAALKPTLTELEAILAQLHASDLHIVRGLSAQDVRNAMENVTVRSSP